MIDRDAALARRLWRRLEMIHIVTYFAAEPTTALADAGYRGYWMGYFAQRAAPLGAAGPEVVGALFYNFSPQRVAKALPDAWGFAPPQAALDARLNGSVAALTRLLGRADPAIAEVARLAAEAARTAPIDGRALFAANRSLPWPDDPLGTLWQAATLLREQRGDGHVAVLAAAGVGGRESNVLQAAAGKTSRAVFAVTRDYDDAEWDTVVEALAGRGALTADGALTTAGHELVADIETRTNRLALAAYDGLDDEELGRLHDGLGPLARTIETSGEVPTANPIGLGPDDR